MIESGQLRAVTSPISLAECLIHPIQQSNLAAINTFTNLITFGANTTFVSIGEAVARTAAELRVKYKFKLPDSLQLAVAIESGCESFLTNDHQLSQVSEIDVIVVDDLEIG
jgi:predicted nucleic acid-binding protein